MRFNFKKIVKLSEKVNGRNMDRWLKSLVRHSVRRNLSYNSTPTFFRQLKDFEPMLKKRVFRNPSFILCLGLNCFDIQKN